MASPSSSVLDFKVTFEENGDSSFSNTQKQQKGAIYTPLVSFSHQGTQRCTSSEMNEECETRTEEMLYLRASDKHNRAFANILSTDIQKRS